MKRYLLDTHVILWMAEDSPRLSDAAKSAITSEKAENYVSIVSAWEVALKLGIGKLKISGGLQTFFDIIDEYGLLNLSIERDYLQELFALPSHHKDPFDRLLVATAMAEGMTLISADENIPNYDVPCLW